MPWTRYQLIFRCKFHQGLFKLYQHQDGSSDASSHNLRSTLLQSFIAESGRNPCFWLAFINCLAFSSEHRISTGSTWVAFWPARTKYQFPWWSCLLVLSHLLKAINPVASLIDWESCGEIGVSRIAWSAHLTSFGTGRLHERHTTLSPSFLNDLTIDRRYGLLQRRRTIYGFQNQSCAFQRHFRVSPWIRNHWPLVLFLPFPSLLTFA